MGLYGATRARNSRLGNRQRVAQARATLRGPRAGKPGVGRPPAGGYWPGVRAANAWLGTGSSPASDRSPVLPENG